MAEMLLESKLDEKEIFRQLVLESRAGAESRVQSGGHSVAAGRSTRWTRWLGTSTSSSAASRSSSTSRSLSKRIDEDWDGVVADLERVRAAVVARANSVTNLTADAKTLESVAGSVEFLPRRAPRRRRGRGDGALVQGPRPPGAERAHHRSHAGELRG